MVTIHLLALTDSISHVHLLISHYLDNYVLAVKKQSN